MKTKLVRECINEKWNDPYNLFKSKDSFQYREKVRDEANFLQQLTRESEDIGLTVEVDGSYVNAFKEGEEQEKWHYDKGTIYYDEEMKEIIEYLT